jgi:hypothetical protein
MRYLDILTEELNSINESLTAKEKGKEIRKILKKEFPKTKFSVTTKHSINIKYTDGPSEIFVDELVNEFESYDRDEATGEILSGGNTFVFIKRNYSDKVLKEVEEFMKNEISQIRGINDWELENIIRQNVYNLLKTTNLDKKIEFNRNPSSHMNQLYIGNIIKDKNYNKIKNKI